MKTTQAQAAAMIRKELKKNGIKAKVTSTSASMMTAVRVNLLEDYCPAVVAKVEAFCNRFQYGHFDSMTDGYDYDNHRDDIPQVKYVTVNANYSEELFEEARQLVLDRVNTEDLFDFQIREMAWRVIRDNDYGFWASRKPKITVAAA